VDEFVFGGRETIKPSLSDDQKEDHRGIEITETGS
jgi:hypothetical protein